MFPLCAIYYTSNISIEEEHKVFFRSVVNVPDNYRRYCGDSHQHYYDFSPFLLLESPGCSKLLWAPPLGPPPKLCPGTLQRSPTPPAGKSNDLCISCPRYDTILNPTNIWWWWGGSHKIVTNRRGINNLIKSFIPFLPPPPLPR